MAYNPSIEATFCFIDYAMLLLLQLFGADAINKALILQLCNAILSKLSFRLIQQAI